MSDEEQRETCTKAVSATACAVVAVGAVSTMNANIEQQHATAEFRANAYHLSVQLADRSPVQIKSEAALFDNPWMRSVEYALERDPEGVLTKYGKRYRDQAALESFTSFTPRHFDAAEKSVDEHLCLSEAIYYEARSESVPGQMAVAEVIYNRVGDHRYPDSVCEVVYQGSHLSTGCQFSFTCDGSMERTPRGRTWTKAQNVATHVMMGLNKEQTGRATHYHTDYVDPVWNKQLVHTETIGTHIFYRFPQGREWRQIRERNANAERTT